MSSKINRRTFARGAAAAGTLAALQAAGVGRVLGANERVRLGFVGVGNRGDQLLDAFLEHKDCDVVALCDAYAPYREAALAKVGGNDKFEVFDYPGRYGKTADGKPLTKVRMEEAEAGFDTVRGASTCCTFTPGGKFTLTGHDYAGDSIVADFLGQPLVELDHRPQVTTATLSAAALAVHRERFPAQLDADSFTLEL